MEVTDLKYQLENRLIKKIDLMTERCQQPHPRRDAVLIMEGPEGEGKTNSACAIAYKVKHDTGRPINLFFRLEGMIKMAQSTEGQIFIWDEPSLDSLGADHYKEINKNLMRLLMTCRIKRHFFIFNFTKFYKFSEYIVVDRALGLIHMYSKNELIPGHFIYVKRRALEALYTGYKVSKKRLYKKLTSFHGRFPDILEKLMPDGSKYFDKMGINVEGIQNATYEQYEAEKNKAIMSIGNEKEKVNKDKQALRALKGIIYSLKLPITTKEELAAQFRVRGAAISQWAKYKNDDFSDSDDDLP